uniref:Uncharacterized protein n=1 Tax=Anopheles merus TaxID=30066 RepID=A0A182V9U5_ANOME
MMGGAGGYDATSRTLVAAGMRHILRVFAGERLLVEHLALAASDQARMAVDAGDQPVAVAGHWVARVRPEAGRDRAGRHGLRALEADHRLRVARVEQLIGPVAAVDAVIVHQARFAQLLVHLAERALVVAGGAFGRIWIDAEQVLAAGRRQGRLVRGELAVTAVDRPVVVAVVVDRTLAVEQQPVLARLERERTVGAEEELVAVVRVQAPGENLEKQILYKHAACTSWPNMIHH